MKIVLLQIETLELLMDLVVLFLVVGEQGGTQLLYEFRKFLVVEEFHSGWDWNGGTVNNGLGVRGLRCIIDRWVGNNWQRDFLFLDTLGASVATASRTRIVAFRLRIE